MLKTLPAVWLVSLFSLSQIAVAQTPAQASPTPGATQQASPPAYRSAFEGYKPYTDDKLLDWKGANDNTGRIGGWRVYAKEARQPDGVAPADSAPKPAAQAGSAKP